MCVCMHMSILHMYSMKHRSHIERRAHELNETQRLTKEIEEKKDEMEAVTERRNQLRGTRRRRVYGEGREWVLDRQH